VYATSITERSVYSWSLCECKLRDFSCSISVSLLTHVLALFFVAMSYDAPLSTLPIFFLNLCPLNSLRCIIFCMPAFHSFTYIITHLHACTKSTELRTRLKDAMQERIANKEKSISE
jgi:hypothetical protein